MLSEQKSKQKGIDSYNSKDVIFVTIYHFYFKYIYIKNL